MSKVEVTAGSQELMEFPDHLAPAVTIEINQDVTTEDRIEGTAHRPVLQQVQRLDRGRCDGLLIRCNVLRRRGPSLGAAVV